MRFSNDHQIFNMGSEGRYIAREKNWSVFLVFSKLPQIKLTLGEVNPLKLFGKSSLADGKSSNPKQTVPFSLVGLNATSKLSGANWNNNS